MDIQYVKDHTIFETIVGSRAYGIHTESSDADIAGVMIPDKAYFLGTNKIEQFQGFPEETYKGIIVEDKVIYEIRKAISLIADNNPNMLDLLAVPDHCIIKTTKYWDVFRENCSAFISKRCRFTYSGYSISQLRRIKSHRRFLLNPIQKKPERVDFNLPEHTIFPTIQLKAIMSAVLDLIPEEKKTGFVNELDGIYKDYIIPLLSVCLADNERIVAMEWLQLSLKSQAKTFMSIDRKYVKDEYIEMAKNEVAYYNAVKEYSKYEEWKRHRNKERAETEEKFGYDLKHASHLVRLMNMGKEILKTGKINVDRNGIDADLLKDIRKGAWTFEQVEKYAEDSDKELEELYKISTLQKTPNRELIEKLCVQVNSEYLGFKE